MPKKIRGKGIRPGDKVILFQPTRTPCIAWVCAETFGPSIYKSGKNSYMVKVTRYEEEATAGKGLHMSSSHIQPYSDKLWEACNKWLSRISAVDGELAMLKRGKIPIDYEKERVGQAEG